MNQQTAILSVVTQHDEALTRALAVLRRGGIIAFPTETVYGLGADAMNPSAVQRVFEVKGRPPTNPLIVHVASIDRARAFAKNLPPIAFQLAEHFWPGPLTIVVEAHDSVPRVVTGGLDTVALRVPKQEFTLRLLESFGGGIVGPSANISGRPSPTLAEHVLEDFEGKIDLILDAGQTHVGLESTVLDITVEPPVILRLGGVTKDELISVIGSVNSVGERESLKQRSPGTRFRHYAPRATVILVEEGNVERMDMLVQENLRNGKKIAVLTHSPMFMNRGYGEVQQHFQGDLRAFARNLFKFFRSADREGCDILLVEKVSDEGLGATIMDRLRRAAEKNHATT